MSEHTPGRVVVREAHSYMNGRPVLTELFIALSHGEDGDDIALASDIANPLGDGGIDDVAYANAQRLAAVWNACDSIPTSSLESGVVKEMLAALEQVQKWLLFTESLDENDGFWSQEFVKANNLVKAALAKARGESQP